MPPPLTVAFSITLEGFDRQGAGVVDGAAGNRGAVEGHGVVDGDGAGVGEDAVQRHPIQGHGIYSVSTWPLAAIDERAAAVDGGILDLAGGLDRQRPVSSMRAAD